MSIIRTLDDLYDHFGLTGPEDDRNVTGLNRRINALAPHGARISIHGGAIPEYFRIQSGREPTSDEIESEPFCFHSTTDAHIDTWMCEMEDRAAHVRALKYAPQNGIPDASD